MKPIRKLKNSIWAVPAMTLTLLAAPLVSGAAEPAPSPASFNEAEELVLPLDYREWIQVGFNVTPKALNDGEAPFNEMRTIYMDRGSFDYWKVNGEFRNGTLLIKEVMGADHFEGVTGKGYAAGPVVAVAVSLKDAELFPEEPGNWGFFRYPKKEGSELFETTSASFPTERCAACHVGAADFDMVFTQYYPVLRDSQGTGLVSVPVE